MDRLRLTFKKGSAVRYISHLDLLRSFTRAMRRSGLPVKYSEGFNPHPQIQFALPMSVGVMSECELVDIMLGREIDLMSELRRLSAQMPAGLEIVEGKVTGGKMPEVTRASYRLGIELERPLDEDLRGKVMDAVRGTELPVEKKTKKKCVTINVLEHLYNFEIEGDSANITMNLTVSAGNTFNLKPELVLEAISAAVPEFSAVDVDVTRLSLI